MKRIYIIIGFVLFNLLVSGCGNLLAADIEPPPNSQVSPVATPEATIALSSIYPLVPPRSADGEALYLEKCAPCHGITGFGDGPQASELPNPVTAIGLKDIAEKSSPAEWYRLVTEGNLDKFMPPFRKLSDRQRWDILAYVYGMSLNAESITSGKELYIQYCSECHGEAGRGVQAAASSIDTPIPDFKNLKYMVSKSTNDFYQVISNGIDPDMPSFGEIISESDRWAIANFVRSLTFDDSVEVAHEETQPANQDTSTNMDEASEPVETVTESEPVATEIGSVIGRVVNASGGETPIGSTVSLYGFDLNEQVLTMTTTIGEDGNYFFEEVEMPPNRVFLSLVEYDEFRYRSETGTPLSNGTTIELPIFVYENTSEKSDLIIDNLHIILQQVDEASLAVLEVYSVSNRGQDLVTAEEQSGIVLNYYLPENASDLEIQEGNIGERFILTEDGFGDRMSIFPGTGEYQVTYSYYLPMNNKVELSHLTSLPAIGFVVIAPESLKIRGENIVDEGAYDIPGLQSGQYHLYTGDSLAAGEEINFVVSSSIGIKPEWFIGLAVFGLVLLGGGVWIYSRNRAQNRDKDIPEDDDNYLDVQTPESIMDAIIALDDLYRSGELPEDAFQKRRSELKNQLKSLIEE